MPTSRAWLPRMHPHPGRRCIRRRAGLRVRPRCSGPWPPRRRSEPVLRSTLSIATQVLIFAAAAMGLNIVVGLAGLLAFGYIAFLGAGAYVGATLSTSAFATIGWKPSFIVVVLV